MRDNKGWDFLTAFEDIDEKYIYQAAKPWKENKIVIVQHYIRGVAACILLVAVIGVGLSHQKKVEAAWYKMTSLIGRILGIEKGTDEYVKAMKKSFMDIMGETYNDKYVFVAVTETKGYNVTAQAYNLLQTMDNVNDAVDKKEPADVYYVGTATITVEGEGYRLAVITADAEDVKKA